MSLSWGIISRYKVEIYGAAILWIMLLHGLVRIAPAQLSKSFLFLTPIIKHGYFGVEIFLFLSGICLFFSMKKDDSISNFYKKRIIRILVPYLLITGSYWFGVCVVWKHDYLRFVENITQYSFWFGRVHFAWFIGAILLFYFLYPLIYRFALAGRSYKHSLLAILTIILGTYAFCFLLKFGSPLLQEWFKEIEIAITRFPVFLLGCYCGRLVYEDKKISHNMLMVSFVGCAFGIYYFMNNFPVVSLFRISGLLLGPCFALWIAILFYVINHPGLNKLFQFLGNRSLELYLTHLALQNILGFLKIFGNSKVHNYHLYLIFCVWGGIIIASIIAIFSNKIVSYLKRYLL